MATRRERIIIEFRADGTRVVTSDIKRVGKESRKAGKSVDVLKKLLLGLGAAEVVRRILKTADAFTTLQNRLRVVTNGTEELTKVTNALFKISERTRSSVEANADLFSRLALSTRDLGTSQKELLQFTESLNQAIIISGASATEANAGLIQLSQGLASGALRGDELRSVLEQLPTVADVISKSLGITRGKLRELGQEGKITSEVILTAFREAREELETQFEKTIPTLSQSLVQLRNEFTKFIGEIDKSSGATRKLSKGIQSAATNVKALATAALVAVLLPALAKTLSLVKKLTLAMKANPLFIVGGAAVVAVFEISKATTEFNKALENLNASQVEQNRLQIEVNRRRRARKREETGGGQLPDLSGALPILGAIGKALVPSIGNLSELFKDIADDLPTSALVEQVDAIKELNAELRELTSLQDKVGAERENAIIFLEIQNQLLATGKVLTEVEKENLMTQIETLSTLRLRAELLEDIKGKENDRIFRTKLLIELEREGKISATELKDALEDLAKKGKKGAEELTTGFDGFRSVLKKLDTTIVGLGKSIANALVGAINSAADALAEFAISGFQNIEDLKQAFSDLFRQLAKDILAAIIRLILLRTLQLLTGTAPAPGANVGGGNVPAGGGSGGLQLQAGGPVSRGRPTIVGERGPELFVPTQQGNVVPNTQLQSAPPMITIVNVSDPDEIPAAINSPEGEQAIMNVIQRQRTQIQTLLV